MNDSTARAAGRFKLLLIASIFFVPLAAAYLLYHSAGRRPTRGAEHGELIDPARPLPEQALSFPDGSTAPIGVLRGSWFLLWLEDRNCDARCEAAFAALARVRLALDSDAARVRRVLLHSGACCAEGVPAAAGADLLVLGAQGESGADFLSRFPRGADGRAGIYVVDPHGNLLMRYEDADAAPGLLKDLERLLRLSRIG